MLKLRRHILRLCEHLSGGRERCDESSEGVWCGSLAVLGFLENGIECASSRFNLVGQLGALFLQVVYKGPRCRFGDYCHRRRDLWWRRSKAFTALSKFGITDAAFAQTSNEHVLNMLTHPILIGELDC